MRPERGLNEWRKQAACAGMNPHIFFVEPSRYGKQAAIRDATRKAKAICATCPVIDACLNYALTHAIPYGVWGGMSTLERRRVRKQRNTEQSASSGSTSKGES